MPAPLGFSSQHTQFLWGQLQEASLPLPVGQAFLPAIRLALDQCQLWSDLIIHRIHLRVFQHIQRLAEQRHSWAAVR